MKAIIGERRTKAIMGRRLRSAPKTASPEESEEQGPDRRRFLALAGGAAAGALAVAAGLGQAPQASARAGDPLKIGVFNNAGFRQTSLNSFIVGPSLATLVLFNPSAKSTALRARGTLNGVLGEALIGVRGRGLEGLGGASVGVRGEGDIGVEAISADVGILASGDMGVDATGTTEGVHGTATDSGGKGVCGEGETGVEGLSNKPDGVGVHGEGEKFGVEAKGQEVGLMARAEAAEGKGVFAEGFRGVEGRSNRPDGVGIFGENTSPGGVGIQGVGSKHGVVARVSSDPGAAAIEALSEAVDGVGIIAEGTKIGIQARGGEAAIQLQGITCLDTVGESGFENGTGVVPTIPRNALSVRVADTRVSSRSVVHVMMNSDPNRGRVSWIERHPGEGFTVHLSNGPGRETSLTYLVIEPCPPA